MVAQQNWTCQPPTTTKNSSCTTIKLLHPAWAHPALLAGWILQAAPVLCVALVCLASMRHAAWLVGDDLQQLCLQVGAAA